MSTSTTHPTAGPGPSRKRHPGLVQVWPTWGPPTRITRAHAACEAGLTGTPGGLGAIPALITLLADEAHVDAIDCGGEGEWRNRGIFALADTTVPCGTSPALEAARALGRLGGAALAPLMSALGDPRAPVRMHAARAVAWMDDPVAAGGAVQRLIGDAGGSRR